jgi:hypothetical protein
MELKAGGRWLRSHPCINISPSCRSQRCSENTSCGQKEIFAKLIKDKRLVSRIFKEFLEVNR